MKLYSLRTLHIHAKSKSDHTDDLDFFLSDLVSWKKRRKYWEIFFLGFVKGEEHRAECSFLFVVRFADTLNSARTDRKVHQILVSDRQTDRQTDGIKILWAWKFIFCIVSAWSPLWRETRTRTSFINSITHKKFKKS